MEKEEIFLHLQTKNFLVSTAPQIKRNKVLKMPAIRTKGEKNIHLMHKK